MRTVLGFFAGAALVCASAVCVASERIEICAKQGRGKGYQVPATLIDGSELNSKTNTVRFTSFAKYVVIFWDEGQASIIELDLPYLSILGTDGRDQEGRKWQISTSSICY